MPLKQPNFYNSERRHLLQNPLIKTYCFLRDDLYKCTFEIFRANSGKIDVAIAPAVFEKVSFVERTEV